MSIIAPGGAAKRIIGCIVSTLSWAAANQQTTGSTISNFNAAGTEAKQTIGSIMSIIASGDTKAEQIRSSIATDGKHHEQHSRGRHHRQANNRTHHEHHCHHRKAEFRMHLEHHCRGRPQRSKRPEASSASLTPPAAKRSKQPEAS